jgi:hypothetical protein
MNIEQSYIIIIIMGSCAIKQQIVDATIIDKQCSKED